MKLNFTTITNKDCFMILITGTSLLSRLYLFISKFVKHVFTNNFIHKWAFCQIMKVGLISLIISNVKMLYEATSGKLWKWPLSDRWPPKSHLNIIYVYTKSFTPISLCGRTQVVYFWVKQNTFMIAAFCQIWCILYFLDYFYVRKGCLIYITKVSDTITFKEIDKKII